MTGYHHEYTKANRYMHHERNEQIWLEPMVDQYTYLHAAPK